jgi:hypothetical protein
MFDPATVLSLALEELVNREGDDIAECDPSAVRRHDRGLPGVPHQARHRARRDDGEA